MPSDWDGSGHYRCLFPGRALRRRGHLVSVAPHQKVFDQAARRMTPVFGARTQDGRLVSIDQAIGLVDFELLVMQQRREAGIAEWLERLGKPTVVDSDDAWFDLPAYNPGSGKPPAETGAMVKQLRACAAMTVSTPELAEMYAPFCQDITVIRNSLDWDLWESAPQQYEKERRKVRVGYMGHASWHSGDLKVLAGVIGPWLEKHPEVEFVAAGDPMIHEHLGIPVGQRVSTTGTDFWHMDLPDITAVMDIGLVPLAKNRMNDCKSHLKGLEYAACGIPCIASPSESYRWWHGVTGGDCSILADRPSRWLGALTELVENETLRRKMGRLARHHAGRHTIDNYADQWERTYERVLGTGAVRAGVAARAA